MPGTPTTTASTWTLKSRVADVARRPQSSAIDGGSSEAVTLAVSVGGSGSSIRVPHKTFWIGVHIGEGKPLELTVSMPGKPDQNLLQGEGDVCILGPNATISSQAGWQDQIVQFRLHRANLSYLSSQWALAPWMFPWTLSSARSFGPTLCFTASPV